MSNIQKEIVALISTFAVDYNVRWDSLDAERVRIHIFLSNVPEKSPEYRKCRNALRKTYGLTPLWNKTNLMIGSNDNHATLVICDF